MEYNPQQLEAINTIDGNVVVVASAGSGKTTVLTNRIKNMVVNHGCDPTTILAITFSRKAKEAISERLDNMGLLGVNIEPFHSLALKIILRSSDGYKHKVWTTAWEKQKVIDDICKSMRLCGKKEKCRYNDIVRFIATQKHHMLSPTDEELIAMINKVEGVKSLEDLGFDESYQVETARLSPYVRARITFMRLLKFYDFYEEVISC